MYTLIMIALALLLVVVNGMFVAVEFAIVKARRTRFELLAEEGNRTAKLALAVMHNLDAYLTACQMGITLASLALGWLGEPAVAYFVRPALHKLGMTNPILISSLAVAVAFSIVSFLHVVFGEQVPKSMSIQKAEETVLLLVWPLHVFYILSFPLISFVNGISLMVLRWTGFSTASDAEAPHSADELRLLIDDSRKEGELEESEGRMLNNIFRFHEKTAEDIMVHRTDTVALGLAGGVQEAKQQARVSGHTRFPVYDGDRDNLIGFIHAKDLLDFSESQSIRQVVRAPLYAYETVHLDKLLRLMQSKRQQFCVVVDEYGVWQGIVTMEDIVESIVGDIQDEFDNEEPDFVALSEGGALISGDFSLEDLAEYMPLHLPNREPEEEYKKIAAYIIEELERIPAEGDSVLLYGKRFTVAAMERNRIRRVRVEDEA